MRRRFCGGTSHISDMLENGIWVITLYEGIITVMRNNQVHKLHKEIIDQLGDLATVVSRSYVYGKIKDATGLSVRHISRIINHTKAVDVR